MAGNLRKLTVSITSAADGSATAFVTDGGQGITGRIAVIQYIADGTNPYSSFTLTITGENSGQSILTNASVAASFVKYPLVAASKGADGSASTLSEVQPIIVGERIKIVLASAGNAKVGVFNIFVE